SLPGAEIKKPSQELIPSEWLELPLKEIRQRVVDQYEREYLTKLLELTNGRISETAERAGIEPRSLNGKMNKYGLRKEQFKRQGS
ncbi:MAG: two-component system response regulator AtoC, partial [Kiritimatiellia bacterium]